MSLHAAQSRAASLVEALTNVLVGYGLAVLAQQLVFPLFGINATLAEHGAIAALFTLLSLLRSFLLRRLFERLARRKRTNLAPGSYRLVEIR